MLKKMLGVNYVKVISTTKKRNISSLRFCAMHFLCLNTDLTLKEIGILFGGRDHSSVINARDEVNRLKGSDEYIDNAYKEILNNLKN